MKICLIGSGNVAYHLGRSLVKSGQQITQIYSRTVAHAERIAPQLAATVVYDLAAITTSADLYLLAVSDGAIETVAAQLPANLRGIVAHTSGATPMQVLKRFERFGVIYPPQSLSSSVDTDYSKIPFAIEGSDDHVQQELLHMMTLLSKHSFLCSTSQRLALHVAAVFANNFVNALFGLSKDLLEKEQLPFELIKPLLLETVQKIQDRTPQQVQTGPAIRDDQQTILRHLDYLNPYPEWKNIYQMLTHLIQKK